jgi:hypothetical protein
MEMAKAVLATSLVALDSSTSTWSMLLAAFATSQYIRPEQGNACPHLLKTITHILAFPHACSRQYHRIAPRTPAVRLEVQRIINIIVMELQYIIGLNLFRIWADGQDIYSSNRTAFITCAEAKGADITL